VYSGQHVGTDPHIQTLLASLTALHPKLVTDIEDTERKMKTQKLLLEKIGTCQQARESLNKMREEHLEKVRVLSPAVLRCWRFYHLLF
jgi:hypothetical protein